MAINLGSNTISALKLGTTTVDKIYLGSTQIYSDSPAPVGPDYGIVTLYGYTSVPYSVSNVVGGTVTIEDEESLDMIFDGSGAASPVNINVTGSSPGNPFTWTVTAYDANLNEVWVDPEMLSMGVSFDIGGLGSFDITFDLTLRGVVVDMTTTSTRTLANQSEFDSLADSTSWEDGIVLSSVPARAVKEIEVGRLITALPDSFASYCENLDTVDLSNGNVTTIGNYVLNSDPALDCQIDLSGVTSIGDSFMSYCPNFVQDIEVPSSVASIGGGFMGYCNNFTGVLFCNTSATPHFSGGQTDYGSLSVSSGTYPAVQSGIDINGTYKQTWKNALPDLQGTAAEQRKYRRLKVVLA